MCASLGVILSSDIIILLLFFRQFLSFRPLLPWWWFPQAKEPREVRMAAIMSLKEVGLVAKQVAEMFGEAAFPPQDKRQYGATRQYGGQAGQQQGASAMERGVERLFQKKVQIFGEIGFQRESVINGVLKICFKTFYECVRLQIFSRSGFQQIQVDVHFLQSMLPVFVEDTETLDFLLHEVLTSCTERCLDPVHMEYTILETIATRSIEEATTDNLNA